MGDFRVEQTEEMEIKELLKKFFGKGSQQLSEKYLQLYEEIMQF